MSATSDAHIRLSRLHSSGNFWEPLGGGPANRDPDTPAAYQSLASVGGVPFVAWAESDGSGRKIRVARPNGANSGWDEVVGGAHPIQTAPDEHGFDTSIVSIGGVPYVAYVDGTSPPNGEQIGVWRLEPDFLSQSAIATANSALVLAEDLRRALSAGGAVRAGGRPVSAKPPEAEWQPAGQHRLAPDRRSRAVDRLFVPADRLRPHLRHRCRDDRDLQHGRRRDDRPAGRDALVSCEVKGKRRNPKIRCSISFPSAGADRVRVELLRHGLVQASGVTRSGGRVVLESRDRLRRGRYTLRILTFDAAGELFVSTTKLRVP